MYGTYGSSFLTLVDVFPLGQFFVTCWLPEATADCADKTRVGGCIEEDLVLLFDWMS